MSRIFLLSLLATIFAIGQEQVAPKPGSPVHDPSGWLDRVTTEKLNEYISKRQERYRVEVFVLIEPIPFTSSIENNAHFSKLGASWSSGNWALIAYHPDHLGAPIITSGGPFLDGIKGSMWDHQIRILRDISMQSWGAKADIALATRRLTDLLVFGTRSKDAVVQDIARKTKVREEKEKRERARASNKTVMAFGLGLAALLISGFLAHRLILATRKLKFPETRWNPRLGARHCGGSSLKHRFQPPQS